MVLIMCTVDHATHNAGSLVVGVPPCQSEARVLHAIMYCRSCSIGRVVASYGAAAAGTHMVRRPGVERSQGPGEDGSIGDIEPPLGCMAASCWRSCSRPRLALSRLRWLVYFVM